MTAEEEARAYLDQALKEAGVDMSAASKALGRNHAYLQQYIRNGKPYWLPEEVREALPGIVPKIDVERLKRPPAAGSVVPDTLGVGKKLPQIDAPRLGKLLQEADSLELLVVWEGLSASQRGLALRLVRQIAAAMAETKAA